MPPLQTAQLGVRDIRADRRDGPDAARVLRHAGQDRAIVGAMRARLHQNDLLETEHVVKLEQLLDAGVARGVGAVGLIREVTFRPEDMDMGIIGAVRHLETRRMWVGIPWRAERQIAGHGRLRWWGR
jgi:hypothetical protein